LARTDISPDDLLAEPGGGVWVSDPDNGYIEKLDAAGQPAQRISDPQAPEGMVDEGGTIVLAEQRPNRLVRFTPPATQRTTVLALPPPGAQAGLDGIHLDTLGHRLLIPDSPHGRLLSAPLDGSAVTTLATGLGRAVDATVGSDGAIWVAVEGDRGLLRVPGVGGRATAVGGAEVTQLDDLVAGPALLYATSLSTHDLIAIDVSNGATRVLVTGVTSPQGLALLSTGRLALSDSTSRVIATVSPCAPS
jgi:sugar lactone lactonase YvrE